MAELKKFYKELEILSCERFRLALGKGHNKEVNCVRELYPVCPLFTGVRSLLHYVKRAFIVILFCKNTVSRDQVAQSVWTHS